MNDKEYMDYLEARFLELAPDSGLSYKKVAPGKGRVVIKENGVVLGELGDPYPTEKILEVLVKETELTETEKIDFTKIIEYTSKFSFKIGDLGLMYSDNGEIIDEVHLDTRLDSYYEYLLTIHESANTNLKDTNNIESHFMVTSTEQVSYDECSAQVLMEAA